MAALDLHSLYDVDCYPKKVDKKGPGKVLKKKEFRLRNGGIENVFKPQQDNIEKVIIKEVGSLLSKVCRNIEILLLPFLCLPGFTVKVVQAL